MSTLLILGVEDGRGREGGIPSVRPSVRPGQIDRFGLGTKIDRTSITIGS